MDAGGSESDINAGEDVPVSEKTMISSELWPSSMVKVEVLWARCVILCVAVIDWRRYLERILQLL